ncbi:MAG: hypothetical protein IPH82_10775 [Chloroflexi bacterium]|nr:hypothetical protein [Chloroflexota bacterium]
MTTRKPYLVTAEGLIKLQKELEQLVTVGREEVADRLQRAFDDGPDDDFIDNAELEAVAPRGITEFSGCQNRLAILGQ